MEENIRVVSLNEKKVETILRKGFGYVPFTEWVEDGNKLIESFDESHKRRKLITKEVLEVWDKSRNNDRLMDWEALRVEFPDDIEVVKGKLKKNGKTATFFKISDECVPFLPSPESYTRARRSLISDAMKKGDVESLKKLMPTDPTVIERRMKREKAIRNYFSRLNYQEKARIIK